MKSSVRQILYPLSILVFLQSCISHKELLYLKNVPDNTNATEDIKNQVELKVQPDDLLSITVSSYNLEASKPYNPDPTSLTSVANSMGGALNTAEIIAGYFVDAEGYIDFPSIGKVYVGQKTLTEVKTTLLEKLKTVLKDPVVNVRFMNLKVSVLGEVNRPGTLRLTNKRLTVFEALSMAGDLTAYANRTNIMLIRESDNKRTVVRLDLQTADIFKSPYYYLQQNDVLVVEPNKTKVNTVADRSGRIIAIISSGISVLALALTFLPRTQ
jgi:polysaccharide biosynthesis/export protein